MRRVYNPAVMNDGAPDPEMEEKLASIEAKYQLALKTAVEEQTKKLTDVVAGDNGSQDMDSEQPVVVKQEIPDTNSDTERRDGMLVK